MRAALTSIFVRFLCKNYAVVSPKTCADIIGYNNCAVMGDAQKNLYKSVDLRKVFYFIILIRMNSEHLFQ